MTLYHYCSTETFVAIVANRSIRLSSLRLSNDTLEGQLVRGVITDLANEERLGPETLMRLEKSFGALDKVFDGLGFCLSEEGDLLSQWRGYADDANGLSIGFGNEYLRKLASIREAGAPWFALQQVQYEPTIHRAKVKPLFDEIRAMVADGAFRTRSTLKAMLDPRTDEEFAADLEAANRKDQQLHVRMLQALPMLFELKSHAFREEREWRLVGIRTPVDEKAEFRGARNRIVPFRSYELRALDVPAIERVYLGPRNITPPEVVQSLLRNNGFGEVEVLRSQASYR